MTETRISDEALIGMVYDAATDPTKWQPFLASFAESFGGFYGHLGARNPANNSIAFAEFTGLERSLVETTTPRLLELLPDDWLDYRNFDAGDHPVNRNALISGERIAEISGGAAYHCREVVTDESYRRTAIYRECRRPFDMEYLLVKRLLDSETLEIVIAVGRRRAGSPFTRENCDRLDRLATHIRRAVDLHVRMNAFAEDRRVSIQALDNIGTGFVLVDVRGEVVFANSEARRLLCERDGIALRNNRLFCDDFTAEARLTDALQKPAIRVTYESTSAIRVPRASKSSPYAVLVSHAWSGRFENTPAEDEHELTAVFISSGPGTAEMRPEAFRQLFDITDAQVRVLRALADGLLIDEIAAALNLSIHTVRAHVKSMCKTLGVSSQTDLVRIAAAAAPRFGT